jgi:archaemetzincin
VYIQPLGHVQVKNIHAVQDAIKLFYGFDCIILQKVNHNKSLYAASKSRYDASKILEYFRDPAKHVIVITEEDIAIRKSDVFTEWGIFGLGSMTHLTCVVSTFRLRSSTDRLQKVTIHELGHNLCLNHCVYDEQCLMHAANGTLKQIDQEKIYFCKVCSSKLHN